MVSKKGPSASVCPPLINPTKHKNVVKINFSSVTNEESVDPKGFKVSGKIYK